MFLQVLVRDGLSGWAGGKEGSDQHSGQGEYSIVTTEHLYYGLGILSNWKWRWVEKAY
jgi:hypothetical protein